jgi:hypothetical protein
MPSVTNYIPWSRVCDLFTTGIEGGCSPWLGKLKYHKTPEAQYENYQKYGQPAFWEGDFVFTLHFDGPEDEEGSFASIKAITPAEARKALQLMASEYPSHFGDFMQENEDAETGDVFLQMLCLGEVIYG